MTTEARGDIQPFIALKQGLKQAGYPGYQVKIATHDTFQEMVQLLVTQAIADSGAVCQDSDAIILTAIAVWG
ncbi:hypothetical protein [Leptolyngbya sp. FACHB-711]|uniref:hypothetical protein n=1 Tax=Leptolyngbya sp. FACHB-711 TaxID=2692813 RepID=UPI00168329EB|nr:hypothetical protein [Leptolyngbya sp. FACHB-711]MBD1848768.1 hypothetical protein [Cyanobacteria bacterium FACHB-502]MBD2026849.1 hypothetical protein [Leptolyngbya sp. FACHB-711]